MDRETRVMLCRDRATLAANRGSRFAALARDGMGLVLLSAALLAAPGCGGEGEPVPPAPPEGETPGTPNEDASLDYTMADVEWRMDAVILDDLADVQRNVVAADHEAGRFIFAPALTGIDELQVGSVALIGGIGIFRILARSSTDQGEQVDVEPALLTDVIENGTIAWRRSFVTSPDDAKIGLGIDEDESETIRQLRQPLGAYENGKLDYSGKIAGFDTTFKLERKAVGHEFSMSAKFEAGRATASAAAKGTLRGLTMETNIEVIAGTLTTFTVRFLNVEGEISIEAGGVELGVIEQKIQIPARLSLPVIAASIPFRIDLGGSMEWSSTLSVSTSAIFKGTTKFKGGVGAHVQEGNVTYLATFESSEVALGEREHVGTTTAGLGVLLNFPEIGFGIGYPKGLDATAAWKFKSEVVSNLSLRYGQAGAVPVIVGNCMTSKVNFGATLVGKVSAIGVTLAEREVALFSKLGNEEKTGNACDN